MAADEVLDVVSLISRLRDYVQEHGNEVLAALVERAEVEVSQAAAAAEMADVSDLLVASFKTPNPISTHIRKRYAQAVARCVEVGLLEPDNVLVFPTRLTPPLGAA